ncbi:methyltransferase [Klosneuvirus KNV1]|uniref:Methyltransferase n=1 Tax=Klosneuvirus KNV1 TaxID=1977640 RepID=A0A1V0SLQ0_9VIRU|nr:methyltransferase [Klosneuvirus KNV1]
MIVSAKYGVPNKYIDVTEKIKEQPEIFYASNTIFSDPAPGVVKHLIIKFNNGISKLYTEESKINKSILLNKSSPTERSNMMMHYSNVLEGKKGLDIGGPHKAFRDLDIYDAPSVLDNLVFKELSKHNSNDVATYKFNGKATPGNEYYCDVVNMSIFQEMSYDFVFAPYVLERLINPLQAIKEITRILKPRGFCIVVLPWKDETGDHLREVSQFSEILDHYKIQRDETDVRDHLYEILCNYDVDRDPTVHSIEKLVERSLDHYENRALNVHVFDFDLIKKCFEFFNYTVIDTQLIYPHHQIVLARLNN